MRILSLGFPLPGPSIDNFSFFNAPSFFDYDALIVDPRALSQLIADIVERDLEHYTFAGERVTIGGGDAAGVPLTELLHARADETTRLLSRGGLIVCLAIPDVLHTGIVDGPGLSRYCWLPEETSSLLAAIMRRGNGTAFAPADLDQPFGTMLTRTKARLTYQVHFNVSDIAFPGTVVGRSVGEAAIAITLPVSGGQLALIPPPTRALDSQGRYQVSEALQDALRWTLRGSSGSSAPLWLGDYSLPGQSERHAALEGARARLAAARDETSLAARGVDSIERLRRILWEEGRFGLEEVVCEALVQLGFRNRSNEPGASPTIELHADDGAIRTGLLEVIGSEEAVGMDAHYRMRRRLEDAIAARAQAPRGLLVVNGFRRRTPSERPAQYTAELGVAAHQLRYGLATTLQVFHALHASLEGDEAIAKAFCERLLATDGALSDD